MQGLIFYARQDAEKNGWFIERMQREGAKRGHLLRLQIIEDGEAEKTADFCINRCREAEISRRFEEAGKKAVNNSQTVQIANNKWLTYQLLKKLGLPCMETRLPGEGMAYPFVMKSLDGHGGSEVFLVQNDGEYENALAHLRGKEFILQRVCDMPGVDVRAYVMGERVLAAVKRTSQTDFRSNFSLGGKVELFELSAEQMQCVKTLQKALDSDYIGIDFIRHGGQWVVNEIEDAAGARMLYSLTEIDFIRAYWEQIEQRLTEA